MFGCAELSFAFNACDARWFWHSVRIGHVGNTSGLHHSSSIPVPSSSDSLLY